MFPFYSSNADKWIIVLHQKKYVTDSWSGV